MWKIEHQDKGVNLLPKLFRHAYHWVVMQLDETYKCKKQIFRQMTVCSEFPKFWTSWALAALLGTLASKRVSFLLHSRSVRGHLFGHTLRSWRLQAACGHCRAALITPEISKNSLATHWFHCSGFLKTGFWEVPCRRSLTTKRFSDVKMWIESIHPEETLLISTQNWPAGHADKNLDYQRR